MIRNQNSGGGGSMLRNADENPTLRGQLPPECQSNQVHGSNFSFQNYSEIRGSICFGLSKGYFPSLL